LERSFRVFQFNITIANIIYTIFRLTILDLAWFGVASDFFMNQDWTAYVDFIISAIFPFATNLFQFLVAANLLTAVRYPFKHKEIWRYTRLLMSCAITWILSILSAIPVIFINPISKARNAVGQGQTTDIPESVRKTCEVAGIICIGALLPHSVLRVSQWATDNSSDSAKIQDAVFYTFFYTIKSAITPIAMLIFFPKIRGMFLSRSAARPLNYSVTSRSERTNDK
ncbi:hypothetical protein PRIPAC_87594, partial [Pristionchus pacificus]|uniref:G_PROTEIN_RECEP_F1_2 domain-containing protein n=1 Tax=Pristionchus pacificus TaxID=54126 RepID=A0A2A6CTV4_PRIPA